MSSFNCFSIPSCLIAFGLFCGHWYTSYRWLSGDTMAGIWECLRRHICRRRCSYRKGDA